MNIADRIQMLRKQKGISQEQLADEIGVSRQLVSKWENEQAIPDTERITILSEYFNTTTDYILKGIEPAESEMQKDFHMPADQVRRIILDIILFICMIVSLILILWIAAQIKAYQGANVKLPQGQTIYKSGYQIFMETSQLSSAWITSWAVLILCGGFEIVRLILQKVRKKKTNMKNI